MTTQLRGIGLVLSGLLLLTLPVASSGDRKDDRNDERKEGRDHHQRPALPFGEASLFFELNDTDGDLGLHALIDGDPWKSLRIEDPRGRKLLAVGAEGRLSQQGLTELTFESGEPNFDELPPEEFFARFPEGEYEIEARTLERTELESTVELSHVMPAPPGNVTLSGVAAAENCDVVPLPTPTTPVLIDWAPVVGSHPDVGADGDIEVEKYQVVVEVGDSILSVDLPPDVTSFEVPEDFTDLSDEAKFEILVRADNGNQTAIESCFEIQ